MNINKKNCIILALATLPMLNSCSDSWLEPKPLSFYSPENTYVDAEGLYAALTACERNMRHEIFRRRRSDSNRNVSDRHRHTWKDRRKRFPGRFG